MRRGEREKEGGKEREGREGEGGRGEINTKRDRG